MKRTVKSVWTALIVLACCICTMFGLVGCKDTEPNGESLEITNRPAQDTIELTDASNTYQLSCTLEGVVWASSDTSVATVNNGLITALSEGATAISVSKDKLSDEFILYVVDNRVVSETVEIAGKPTDNKVNLTDGTLTLTATCSDGSDVEWLSMNPDVATVENGVVTLLTRGEATIVAYKADNRKVCEEYTLRVIGESVTSIAISGLNQYKTIYTVGSVTLTTVSEPENCEPYEVVWSVDDDSIASVDENGVLSGLQEGATTVTATVKDTTISATETVQVKRSNYEDFSSAEIMGNYIIGGIEILDEESGYEKEIVEDSATGNKYLKLTYAPLRTGYYGYLTVKFGGLTVGETYKFSYDIQSIEGYYFAQINHYEDGQGRLTDASSSFLTQWNPHEFYLNDGNTPYSWDWVTTDSRFNYRTVNVKFVAGTENVLMKFLPGPHAGVVIFDNMYVEKAPAPSSVEMISPLSSKKISVGKTVAYQTAAFPAISALYEMEWSVSDEDVATIDKETGVLTAKNTGSVVVTGKVKGSTIEFSETIQVIPEIKKGLVEDFSNGYIAGNTYYGAWEITAAAQHNISLTNDGRLYLTTTVIADGEGIWSPVTISGLTPGKVYRFSYDAQVDEAASATVGGGNYHMCGWRVFVDSNGYFVQDGNQAVFTELNSMYSNDGSGHVIDNSSRFSVNHFYGLFVAGSETVTFMLSTNPHTTATYYDNFKMEEVNSSNELATIEAATDNVLNAAYVAKLGERNVPNQKHLTWEIDNTEIASIAVGATQNEVTLTALSGGNVTITLKFMGIVIATKEIQVQEPAIVSEIAISGPSEIGTGKTGTYTQASAILVKPYTVTWSVDDETKATIDPQTGVLTGVSEGSVVVKAQVDGSDVYATKEVEITPVNLLKIDFEDMEAMTNYTCQPVNEQIGVGVNDGRELYYQGQPTGFVTSHEPYLGEGGGYAIFIEDQGGERGNVLHTISNGISGLLQLYIKYTPEMIEAIEAGGSLTFKVKCSATTIVYTDTSFTGTADAIAETLTAGEWTTVTISNETLVANGAATQGWFRVCIVPEGLQRLYLDDIEIVPASAQ